MPRPPDAARTESPEERRERAWHLVVVRRLTEREAARILEVHEGTVRRDLAAMRARGQKAVEHASTRKGVLREAWARSPYRLYGIRLWSRQSGVAVRPAGLMAGGKSPTLHSYGDGALLPNTFRSTV